jgi:hypothetical protein
MSNESAISTNLRLRNLFISLFSYGLIKYGEAKIPFGDGEILAAKMACDPGYICIYGRVSETDFGKERFCREI